jgi:hypothetical protein
MPPPCGEVVELAGQDHLWRQLRDSEQHLAWDYDNNAWLPSPAALQFDPELSTRWAEHLLIHGLGPEDILDKDKGYSLVGQWEISPIRSEHFPVAHTPCGAQPLDCAHSSVYWPPDEIPSGKVEPNRDRRRDLRSTLADEMTWTHGQITTQPPDAF